MESNGVSKDIDAPQERLIVTINVLFLIVQKRTGRQGILTLTDLKEVLINI
jgi:hypothetical protein